MKNNLFNLFTKKQNQPFLSTKSYFVTNFEPSWMSGDYNSYASQGYSKNVIAYRCVNLIAQAAASVPFKLYRHNGDVEREITQHKILTLLKKPNPLLGGAEFFENLFAYRLISGDAYMTLIKNADNKPELYLLRPDRVKMVTDNSGMPYAYEYDNGEDKMIFEVNQKTMKSNVLHFRYFNPLSDYQGLSPMASAAYAIDQHNMAAKWNQAMLQNGARPSGALIMKNSHGSVLTDEQFERLKEQVNNEFSSAHNAGKPLLLEGGLEWKEMSLSPKDMDFIECKNSAARDIALAFGVPPQLLGIPGDNTYSNYEQARMAFWEETVMPMLDHLQDALNNWLVEQIDGSLELKIDKAYVETLTGKRERQLEALQKISFISDEQKRKIAGF